MFVIDLQNMISLEGAHVPFFFFGYPHQDLLGVSIYSPFNTLYSAMAYAGQSAGLSLSCRLPTKQIGLHKC